MQIWHKFYKKLYKCNAREEYAIADTMTKLPAALSNGGAVAGSNRLAITKKLVLGYVVLLQLIFIACFWLLQMSYNSSTLVNVEAARSAASTMQKAVNFVKRKPTKRLKIGHGVNAQFHQENVNSYEVDFYQEKTLKLNRTQAEYEMGMDLNEDLEPLWCYREGSLNETKSDLDIWPQQRCVCAPGWHGKDCGQPEIIWRALMAYSRRSSTAGSATLQLREARLGGLHRLYYIIELSYISWELVELQLRSIIEVVDCYLIYYVSHSKYHSVATKTLERGLATLLVNSSYLLYQCQQWRTNCSVALAYKYFRNQLTNNVFGFPPMKSTDLVLYSNVPAIFAPHALKFLKYYAVDVLPVHFRLKHNVYGYYWQHPQLTQVSCVISSLIHLHNPHLGRSDPLRLLLKSPVAPVLTIGDLNHYGGWYCQYCMQPDEIVELLQATISTNSKSVNSSSQKGSDAVSLTEIKFPTERRNQHIDSPYIQQLIAHGLHLDGKTQLQKIHRYADKYYAPVYANTQNAKYAHLLVNLYESLDDDDDEEENGVYN